MRDEVTPNRRGMKSRELVLDAAERVMAEHGFEAATVARVVEEAGIPLSSVYHYYGSKDGILLAVMQRGAERFFADLPDSGPAYRSPAQHLARSRLGRGPHARASPELPAPADRPRRAAAGRRRRRDPGGHRPDPRPGPEATARGRSASRSATIRTARPRTSSRASPWPPSTAPSWHRRLIPRSVSSGCSHRSRPRSSRHGARCWSARLSRRAADRHRARSVSATEQPCDEPAVRILVALVAQELDAHQDGLLDLVA